MSAFDLEISVGRAQKRLADHPTPRRRSDAGKMRMPELVRKELRALLLGFERPRMAEIQSHLQAVCARAGVRAPSRAALYQALARIEGHSYLVGQLPQHVQNVLYNLDADASIPGHQLAFYCLNYGSLSVLSYAAGLPWLDLYQAARQAGWRPRSRGLLDAVLKVRGIS